MILKKQILVLGITLLFVLVLFSSFSSAYRPTSNPMYYSGGVQSSFLSGGGTQDLINTDMCQKGTDFILQIDSAGCNPPVVRSDLLEEQDVPVFCPIQAIKINPVIDVEAIRGMSFSGDYSQDVSNIGFYGSRSALGFNEKINSFNYQNVGYAVIWLRNNPNESAMPEFVEGKLKATITYDIENAFGVRTSQMYMPVLDDNEWNRQKVKYYFWDGRGYIRVEDINVEGAKISIYSDQSNTFSIGNNFGEKRKVGTTFLREGEKSNIFYLPGLGCFASLRLQLQEIGGASEFATLKINSEYYDVSDKEYFLDNKCRILDINKNGVMKTAQIRCNEDQLEGQSFSFFGGGTKTFELTYSPKINLEIDGDLKKDIQLGDWLYSTSGGAYHVYLGYLDSNQYSDEKEETLKAYLVSLSDGDVGKMKNSKKLDSKIIDYYNKIASFEEFSQSDDKGFFIEMANAYTSTFFRTWDFIAKGRDYKTLKYGESGAFEGKTVKLIGYSAGTNVEISNLAKDYYDKAIESYDEVINKFVSERYPTGDKKTVSEKAYRDKIELAFDLNQNSDALEWCGEFSSYYPDAEKIKRCSDKEEASNSGVSTQDVFIDGKVKEISLKGIYEPTVEDYSVEVQVSGYDYSFILKKGENVYLNKNLDETEEFIISQGSATDLYFKYSSEKGKWIWSPDRINWMEVSELEVKGGKWDGDKPVKANQQLILSLKKKNFIQGAKILEPTINSEFIRLVSIDNQDTATISLNIQGKSNIDKTQEFISGKDWTFKEGVTQQFGNYAFTVKKINYREYAKVKIVPDLKFSRSEANVSFKIGIEKRGIQLSPEVTQRKIDNLNETIQKWEDISNGLGKVVQTMKTACLITGTALTIENLLENAGGKAIARQEVMQGKGGWNEKCSEYAKVDCDGKPCNSKEQCFLKNANEIENEVGEYNKAMNEQNEEIKQIQSKYESNTGFLGEKVVNSYNSTLDFTTNVKTRIGGKITNSKGETIDLGEFKDTLLIEDSFKKHNYDFTDLKEIDLYYGLMNSAENSEDKQRYADKLYASVYGVQKNSERYVQAKTYEAEKGEGISTVLSSENLKIIKTEKFVKLSETQYAEIYSGLEGNVHFVKTAQDGEDYMVIYDDSGVVQYTFKYHPSTRGYDQEEDKNILDLQFKKYDHTTYYNAYLDPEVRYYEAEPYKGLPAIIPMSLTEGWYVYVKQTLPVGGAIASYDLSGAVRSYWICNVGENGREEFTSGIGDDICEMINEGINQPITFPGLDDKAAANLISHARMTIEYLSRQYDSAVKTKRVNVRLMEGGTKVMKVGEPETNNPSAECTDFMSVKDCQLLFNVCDPVICPTSRCDFGGAYPVKDVIQSGIIGSIALCLPNAKNGVYIPVCLTGIQAGIDGWLSVTKSYKDCLEKNLETGETVGICDEVNSIYMCEFFWRQALPVAKLAIPKILGLLAGETSRGGGEYLGVQTAWDNAQDSVNYLTQYYAANSYKAFKFRNTEEIGSAVCKNYVSLTYPEGSNLLDVMTTPDSPPQFNGRFDEIPFTTATNPPISHYKVFYHIYAGKDRGAYFRVYMRGEVGSSYYQTGTGRLVASGYIAKGEYATDTVDFTGPQGFGELCIDVNGQEECDFGQVSTNFAIDYIEDQYLVRQANETGITSEKGCISGTADIFQLFNPNIQEGVGNMIDPQIYNEGIVRICATDNPGSSSDTSYGLEDQRWVEVGYCGDKNIKCWVDRKTIGDAFEFETSKNKALEGLANTYINNLFNQSPELINSQRFSEYLEQIKNLEDPANKLKLIEQIIGNVFYSNERAHILWLKGSILGILAKSNYLSEECARYIPQYYSLFKEYPSVDSEIDKQFREAYAMVLANPCLINVHLPDIEWTILHLTAENIQEGDLDKIKELLRLGADPNSQTWRGETPLHLAAFLRNYEIVEVLVEGGANPCIRTDVAFNIEEFVGQNPRTFPAGSLPVDYVSSANPDKDKIIDYLNSFDCPDVPYSENQVDSNLCAEEELTLEDMKSFLENEGMDTSGFSDTKIEKNYHEKITLQRMKVLETKGFINYDPAKDQIWIEMDYKDQFCIPESYAGETYYDTESFSVTSPKFKFVEDRSFLGIPTGVDVCYKFFDDQWHWTKYCEEVDGDITTSPPELAYVPSFKKVDWVPSTILSNPYGRDTTSANEKFIKSLQGKSYGKGIVFLTKRLSEDKDYMLVSEGSLGEKIEMRGRSIKITLSEQNGIIYEFIHDDLRNYWVWTPDPGPYAIPLECPRTFVANPLNGNSVPSEIEYLIKTLNLNYRGNFYEGTRIIFEKIARIDNSLVPIENECTSENLNKSTIEKINYLESKGIDVSGMSDVEIEKRYIEEFCPELGDFDVCEINGDSGVCLDIGNYECSNGFQSGYCPGASNVQCCIGDYNQKQTYDSGKCVRDGGKCLSVGVYYCSENFKQFMCPGSSNVQCCMGTFQELWTSKTAIERAQRLTGDYSKYPENEKFIDEICDGNFCVNGNPLLTSDECVDIRGKDPNGGFWKNLWNVEEDMDFVYSLLFEKYSTQTSSNNLVYERRNVEDLKLLLNNMDSQNIIIEKRVCDCGALCNSYSELIVQETGAKNIPDELLFLSLIMQESNCRDWLTGSQGEKGLMQIKQDTFDSFCKNKPEFTTYESFQKSASQQLSCGALILKSKYDLYKDGPPSSLANYCSPNSESFKKYNEYTGWKSALRGYNGWGCGSGVDTTYVEKIMDRYYELVKLYSNFLEIGGETCEIPPTLNSIIQSTTNVNKRVVDSTVYYNGKNVPDEINANCFAASEWIYESVKVGKACKYSDKMGKNYIVDGKTITTKSSGTYVVNPSACERVGAEVDLNENQKLNLLEGGDMIDFYYWNSQHTAIFIKWIDESSYKAQLFDWSGPKINGIRTYRYFESSLDDGEHPVYLIRKPILV